MIRRPGARLQAGFSLILPPAYFRFAFGSRTPKKMPRSLAGHS